MRWQKSGRDDWKNPVAQLLNPSDQAIEWQLLAESCRSASSDLGKKADEPRCVVRGRACAPCIAGAQWDDPLPLCVYHYVGSTGLRKTGHVSRCEVDSG